MPAKLLWLSLGLFAVNGILEGAITLAAVRAIERLNPRWTPAHAHRGSRALGAVAVAAVVLVAAGILAGSAAPEVLEKLAGSFGIAAHAPSWMHAPLADYEWKGVGSGWLRRASAALAGLALVYGACAITGRAIHRLKPVPRSQAEVCATRD